MALSNNSLIYFASDSLAAYSEDFRILRRENPVLVELNGSIFSVHISSIHDSGNTRTNEDEERIQIRRTVIDEQRSRAAQGITPLFIGFFPEGEVFTAWEPAHVFSQNPEKGGSVYARWSHNACAKNFGAALRVFRSTNLGRHVTTVALRTEALGFYFENSGILHRLSDEGEMQGLIQSVSKPLEADAKPGLIEEVFEVRGERERITIARKAFPRDPRFRQNVLEAYDGSCCICDRQLGLVEAAHVIPHAHPDCVEHVTNGLALCIEHHRLYDDALLLPTSGRRLHLNLDRVEHLENTGRAKGLAIIKTLAMKEYKVPGDAANCPNPEWLERGVRIRLGVDA